MRVHHLNCATMRMPGAPLVCHVLLVETPDGLVLVDTGFGLRDIADPRRSPRWPPAGHPADPGSGADRGAAGAGAGSPGRRRPAHPHDGARPWSATATAVGARPAHRHPRTARGGLRGFAAAEGLVMIPLPGHTRGHTASAVDTGDGWVLHTGNAFHVHSVLDGRGRQPLARTLPERVVAADCKRVRANHERLAELARSEPDVLIVSAHDPSLLETARHRHDRKERP